MCGLLVEVVEEKLRLPYSTGIQQVYQVAAVTHCYTFSDLKQYECVILQFWSEYSGLISFRIDWFDLLVVQGNLKSLPQPHSSKASILQCSAFFIEDGQLSCIEMPPLLGAVRWLLPYYQMGAEGVG